MKMKARIVILLLMTFIYSLNSYGQTTIVTNEYNLINKEDVRKKSGWIKLKLDENFNEVLDDSQATYEYFDFVNIQGYFTATYSSKTLFHNKKFRKVYNKNDSDYASKLLNGTVDFYDRKNCRVFKYLFKNGFCVKMYDFKWPLLQQKYNGKLRGVIEYQSQKNALECWGNYYDTKGVLKWDIHERYDGSKFKNLVSLPIRPSTISLEELNIGKAWQPAEFDSYKYHMFIDTIAHDGGRAATIQSIYTKIKGSGALLQTFKAENFLGKRVRMSGYMKSENVKEWAGFWLNVNQTGTENSFFFDNMKDRPIKGTSGWVKYEIVFDVPVYASTIRFGAIIHGTGQIWFDDLRFEIVDDSVKTTGWTNQANRVEYSTEPVNLDFEK